MGHSNQLYEITEAAQNLKARKNYSDFKNKCCCFKWPAVSHQLQAAITTSIRVLHIQSKQASGCQRS